MSVIILKKSFSLDDFTRISLSVVSSIQLLLVNPFMHVVKWPNVL